jgi:uncharacterized protein YycO
MQLGDFCVMATKGFVPWCIRVITRSPVNHAALYVGGGQLVEAQPQGAILVPVTKYDGYRLYWSNLDLTGTERKQIALAGLNLRGTPYAFADILAQVLVRVFKWRASFWAKDRAARPDRLQCAQLVEAAYLKAGIVLLPKTPRGMVSPGDLYDLIERTGSGETDERPAQAAA